MRRLTPLRDSEFASLLQPFLPLPSSVAVGFSGGGDSSALLNALESWRQRGQEATKIFALIIDHAMRGESEDEARRAAARARAMRTIPIILRHRGRSLRGGSQERARLIRYILMLQWCQRTRTPHLMLAHHLEDQAETFLIRLSHGSGLDGLASMEPSLSRGGVRILRPLLSVPKARLLARLQERGVSWIEDPSNDDKAFARVRIRQARPLLDEKGFSPERLARAARSVRHLRGILDEVVEVFLSRHAVWERDGACRINMNALRHIDREIALRVLRNILMTVGRYERPPKSRKIAALYDALLEARPKRRTVARCLCVPQNGEALFQRERRHV